MNLILKGAHVYIDGEFKKQDILISNGRIAAVCSCLYSRYAEIVDCENKNIFPGFTDVHVHLREPGFIYKENIHTGSLAAAHGGYTTVCPMPNLDPVPDCRETLETELEIIRKTAVINVIPFGSITKGELGQELSDMDDMAPDVAGFSDDGRGVQSAGIMRDAMLGAKALGRVISAHCEDKSLVSEGGCINDGNYSRIHGLPGISAESEWKQVERDLNLAAETGCKYHVCHVSTAESVELIREAKARGVDVTCETAPHYLVLTEDDLRDDGRFKMNPPLRTEDDRQALIEGIADGTIDMIATDHAPHSAEEKSRGLRKSLMGIVGLECSFPVLYTEFVRSGIISLERLIELMSVAPSERFGLENAIRIGSLANLTVFDLNKRFMIDSDGFLSKGRSTPFDGRNVYGKCLRTIANGEIAFGSMEL